jgi:hypothetical protein
MTGDPTVLSADSVLKDLCLADLQRFEEAMRHNEDIGEKRFNFFMALVTAVCAGLGRQTDSTVT